MSPNLNSPVQTRAASLPQRYSALLALLTLSACAPAATQPLISEQQQRPLQVTAPASAVLSNVQAAFSEEGVVWSDGRQACVARVPQLQPVCPAWPAPTGAVAWHEGRAWVALPTLGQVVTVDGAAQSVVAGRVVALSSTRIYREDGSALTYSGVPTTGTVGRPSAVITGGDGQDYALVASRLVKVGSESGERVAGSWLRPTRTGTEVSRYAGVNTLRGPLELRNGQVWPAAGQSALSLETPVLALGLIKDEPYALTQPMGAWQLRLIR